MKNRAAVGVVLVVLASLTSLTATGWGAEANSGKVEIKNDFIVVHPGTKLSKADTKALNDVLKQYDKSLYKIEIYKNGKVTKTLGKLNDMQIDQKAVADLTQAKKTGQSERAIQLIAPSAGPQKGAAVNPQTGSPTPGVAVNPQTGTPAPRGMAPVNPQTITGPMPSGPQKPTSPAPSGPQMPTSPAPSGPQMPTSPAPSGPQMPTSPAPSGPQKSPSSPVNPQTIGSPTNPQQSSTTDKQTAEFMQRLKPILEKYSQ